MRVGKAQPPLPAVATLNGMFAFGTQSPQLTPEVRHRSAEGGGDFCLPYGAASALHRLGDSKLSCTCAVCAVDGGGRSGTGGVAGVVAGDGVRESARGCAHVCHRNILV